MSIWNIKPFNDKHLHAGTMDHTPKPPMSILTAINISLEYNLEKGPRLPLLAKGCQTCERVGRPVVAKVSKHLQNLAVANA